MCQGIFVMFVTAGLTDFSLRLLISTAEENVTSDLPLNLTLLHGEGAQHIGAAIAHL